MLARLLFATVWLLIAAGVVLPLFPLDVAAPRLTAADGTMPFAQAMATGCEGCTTAAEASRACSRRRGVGAAAAGVCVSLRVQMVVHPAPADPPAPPASPPLKLPAV
jgi:hypothetical protein